MMAHLKDDNEQLRRELGRMTKALEEERALAGPPIVEGLMGWGGIAVLG